jgi:RND family efflux transporter MFP subunit
MQETYNWHRPPTLLILLLFLFILHFTPPAIGAPSGPDSPPPVVEVAQITKQDITPVTEYVGHIEAIQAVDLRARVEGILQEVNFKEGDYVRTGEVLYVIEQAPYRAELEADRARLRQAEAELTRAGQHLKRLQEAGPDSIPATEMDNAVAAELVARAQVNLAEAEIASSELDLDYTTIRAPIDGRIGRTAYTRGNLVGPSSDPLARIVQMDPVRVVYSISENDLAAITTALKDTQHGLQNRLLAPQLRLSSGDLLKEVGQISFVDNEVDASTGTIAVRANFANPDGLLIPGQYVTVLARGSEPKMMAIVPQAAVLINQEGHFVLVVDDNNVVSSRPITIGTAVDTLWVVESGLEAGEQVIIQGIQKVQPGQTVQIKADQPQEK